MDTQKPIQFNGTAGGFFLLSIIGAFMLYVPFFGWAFLLNFASEWLADNTLINGRKVSYKAGYSESLKFVTISALLLLVTLGIYSFWLYPKMYRYMSDHTQYADVPAPVAYAAAPVAADPMSVQPPAATPPVAG